MVEFTEFLTRDLRLVMLRLLAEDPGYSMNDSILQGALELYGHNVSRDKVKTELRWLEEQGLVDIEIVAKTVMVAKLTGRGLDCAQGKARVDGVRPPRPRG